MIVIFSFKFLYTTGLQIPLIGLECGRLSMVSPFHILKCSFSSIKVHIEKQMGWSRKNTLIIASTKTSSTSSCFSVFHKSKRSLLIFCLWFDYVTSKTISYRMNFCGLLLLLLRLIYWISSLAKKLSLNTYNF